ncbi:hypothetical protein [Actinomadura rugatobispora]|uniref:Uncharacterized protein n=1 Tax=Actinomadura rugatobispora TaxID=1994 RepID=A0ABW1AC22_9ACTN
MRITDRSVPEVSRAHGPVRELQGDLVRYERTMRQTATIAVCSGAASGLVLGALIASGLSWGGRGRLVLAVSCAACGALLAAGVLRVGRGRLRDRLDRMLAAEAVHHEQAIREQLERLRHSGLSRGKLARSCVHAIEMTQRAKRRRGGGHR